MPNRKERTTRAVYNPTIGDTQRRRIPVARSDATSMSRLELTFCELCWRRCELEATLADPPIYERKRSHLFTKIECTPSIHEAASRHADSLAEHYAAALQGIGGPYALGRLLAYVTVSELRGHRSVAAFRQRAYEKECLRLKAKSGSLLGTLASPGINGELVKPSAHYCAKHNPRRSIEARRLYQRDRRFQGAFDQAIEDIYEKNAHEFRRWHPGDHAKIRKMAYERARGTATIDLIRGLERHGMVSRAEIAQKLGISRQAVYAAIKAGAPSRRSRRINGRAVQCAR